MACLYRKNPIIGDVMQKLLNHWLDAKLSPRGDVPQCNIPIIFIAGPLLKICNKFNVIPGGRIVIYGAFITGLDFFKQLGVIKRPEDL